MENGDFLLRIDDLLDFSNQEEEEEEEGVGREEEEEEEEEEIAGRLSASDWPQQQQRLSSSIEYTASAPLLLSNVELCVPREDMAHLEWLSNFEESMSSNVDASLCGTSHGFSITPKLLGQSCSVNKEENQSYGCGYGYAYGERGGGLIEASEEEFGLLRRRRRKPRLRTTWDSRVMLIDYSDARASPAASVLFESPSSTSTVTDSGDDRTHFLLSKKKVKVEKIEKAEKMIETSPVGRKCLHCAVTKTPQWRAGPQGPKTLCNACGVRYKSGRLLPEYRPAASPTFVHTLHSNSHRKVVEMHKLRHQSSNNNDGDGDGDDDDVNDSIGMARYKPWEMKPQNPKVLNPYAPKPQNPKIPKP